MKTYTPKPLNTDKVELPEDLQQLTEKLAENAHDHWAKLRIKEGWSLGEQRDDKAKTHPDLIPYNELTNSEQEYDRNSAMETLKAIMSLGYKIEKIQ
jgi:hypothetical protein